MTPETKARIDRMAPHVAALDDVERALRAVAELTDEQLDVATQDGAAHDLARAAREYAYRALDRMAPTIAECDRACEAILDEALPSRSV